MNRHDQKKTFLERQEKEDKHGKKEGWEITPTRFYLMRKSQVNLSNSDLEDVKRKDETNHGRFVQGIRNALAT